MRGLRVVLLIAFLVAIFGASAIAQNQHQTPYTPDQRAAVLAKFGQFCTEQYYSDPNHNPELHYCSAYIDFTDTDSGDNRIRIAKVSTLNLETGELTISSPVDSPPRPFWPTPKHLNRLKLLYVPHMKENI